MSDPAGSVGRMHEHDSTTDLAQLQTAREEATAAVKAHAKLSRPNSEAPPEAERQQWEAAGQAWSEEWQRLMHAERDAALAVHRARQAAAE